MTQGVSRGGAGVSHRAPKRVPTDESLAVAIADGVAAALEAQSAKSTPAQVRAAALEAVKADLGSA